MSEEVPNHRQVDNRSPSLFQAPAEGSTSQRPPSAIHALFTQFGRVSPSPQEQQLHQQGGGLHPHAQTPSTSAAVEGQHSMNSNSSSTTRALPVGGGRGATVATSGAGEEPLGVQTETQYFYFQNGNGNTVATNNNESVVRGFAVQKQQTMMSSSALGSAVAPLAQSATTENSERTQSITINPLAAPSATTTTKKKGSALVHISGKEEGEGEVKEDDAETKNNATGAGHFTSATSNVIHPPIPRLRPSSTADEREGSRAGGLPTTMFVGGGGGGGDTSTKTATTAPATVATISRENNDEESQLQAHVIFSPQLSYGAQSLPAPQLETATSAANPILNPLIARPTTFSSLSSASTSPAPHSLSQAHLPPRGPSSFHYANGASSFHYANGGSPPRSPNVRHEGAAGAAARSSSVSILLPPLEAEGAADEGSTAAKGGAHIAANNSNSKRVSIVVAGEADAHYRRPRSSQQQQQQQEKHQQQGAAVSRNGRPFSGTSGYQPSYSSGDERQAPLPLPQQPLFASEESHEDTLAFLDDPARHDIRRVDERESERLARIAFIKNVRRQKSFTVTSGGRANKKANSGGASTNGGGEYSEADEEEIRGSDEGEEEDHQVADGRRGFFDDFIEGFAATMGGRGGGDIGNGEEGSPTTSAALAAAAELDSSSDGTDDLSEYTDDTDSEGSVQLDILNPAVNLQFPKKAVRVDLHQTMAILQRGPNFASSNGNAMFEDNEEDEAAGVFYTSDSEQAAVGDGGDDEGNAGGGGAESEETRSAGGGGRRGGGERRRTLRRVSSRRSQSSVASSSSRVVNIKSPNESKVKSFRLARSRHGIFQPTIPVEAMQRSKKHWFYQVPIRAAALEHSSFFVIPPFTVARIVLHNVFSHAYYEAFLFLVILANCIFVATETPRPSFIDKPAYQFFTEWIFALFFSVEMVLKLFTYGAFIHKKAYFREAMNCLDAVVVGFSWAAVFAEFFGNYTPLRLIRLVKCLRVINTKASKTLSITIHAVRRSLLPLAGIFVGSFLVMWFFALFGVQLWMGQFTKRCVHETTGAILDPTRGCSSDYLAERYEGTSLQIYWGRYCPPEYLCHRVDEGHRDYSLLWGGKAGAGMGVGYDNLGAALLATFNIFAFDHWASSIMDMTFDTMSMWTFFYFLVAVGVLAYWIPALCVAVVISKMREARDAYEERQLRVFEALKREHAMSRTLRRRIPRPIGLIMKMKNNNNIINKTLALQPLPPASTSDQGARAPSATPNTVPHGASRSPPAAVRSSAVVAGVAPPTGNRPRSRGRAAINGPASSKNASPEAATANNNNNTNNNNADGRAASALSSVRPTTANANKISLGSESNKASLLATWSTLRGSEMRRGGVNSAPQKGNGGGGGVVTTGTANATNATEQLREEGKGKEKDASTLAAEAEKARRARFAKLSSFIPRRVSNRLTVEQNLQLRLAFQEHFGKVRDSLLEEEAQALPSPTEAGNIVYKAKMIEGDLGAHTFAGTNAVASINNRAALLKTQTIGVGGGNGSGMILRPRSRANSATNMNAPFAPTTSSGFFLGGASGDPSSGGVAVNPLLSTGTIHALAAMLPPRRGPPSAISSANPSRAATPQVSTEHQNDADETLSEQRDAIAFAVNAAAAAAAKDATGNANSEEYSAGAHEVNEELGGGGEGGAVRRVPSINNNYVTMNGNSRPTTAATVHQRGASVGANANTSTTTTTTTLMLNRTLNQTADAIFNKTRGAIRNAFTLSRSRGGLSKQNVGTAGNRNSNPMSRNGSVSSSATATTNAVNASSRNKSVFSRATPTTVERDRVDGEENVGDVAGCEDTTELNNMARLVGGEGPILVQDPEGGDLLKALRETPGGVCAKLSSAWEVIRNTVHRATEGYPRVVSLYILAQQDVDKEDRIPAEFQPSALRALLKRRQYVSGSIYSGGVGVDPMGSGNKNGRRDRFSDDAYINAYYDSLLDDDTVEMTPLEIAYRIRDTANPTPFNYLVGFLVLLDVAFLGVKHVGMSDDLFKAADVISFVCTAIFTFDLFLRFVGLGHRMWLSDWMNYFNFAMLVFAYIEFGLNGTVAVSALSAVRLLRLGRAFPSAHVRHICRVYLNVVPYAVSITVILVLFLFMATLLGMQLLYGKFGFDPLTTPRSNFNSFLTALFSIMQTITRDDWTLLNYSAMHATSWGIAFFFIAVLLVGYLLFIPLYIGAFVLVFEDDVFGDGAPNRVGLMLVETKDEYYTYIHTLEAKRSIEEARYQKNIRAQKAAMNGANESLTLSNNKYNSIGYTFGAGARCPDSVIRMNTQMQKRIASSRREAVHYAGERKLRRLQQQQEIGMWLNQQTIMASTSGRSGSAPPALAFSDTIASSLGLSLANSASTTAAAVTSRNSNRIVIGGARSASLGGLPPLPQRSSTSNRLRGPASSLNTNTMNTHGSLTFGATATMSGGGYVRPSRPSSRVFSGTVKARVEAVDDAVLFPPLEADGDTVEMTYTVDNVDGATNSKAHQQKGISSLLSLFSSTAAPTNEALRSEAVVLAPALPAPPGMPQRTPLEVYTAHSKAIALRKAKQAVLSSVRRYVDAQVVSAVEPTKTVIADTLAQLWESGMLLHITLEELIEHSPLTGRTGWDMFVEELEDAQAVLDLQVGEEQVGRGGNAVVMRALLRGHVIDDLSVTRGDYSLFLLSPNNKLRRLLIEVTESLWFEVVSFAMVLCSALILAIYNPRYATVEGGGKDAVGNRNRVLDGFDDTFTVFFTIELCLRILAQGFIWRPFRSFLWSGWSIIDLTVVVVSLLSWASASSGVYVRYIKVIRLARVLKLAPILATMRELRVVSLTILRAAPSILVVALTLAFDMLVWAVMAIPSQQNRQNYCTNPLIDNYANCTGFYNVTIHNVTNPSGGGGLISNETTVNQTLESRWIARERNFDNVGNGMLAMVEAVSGEWWIDLLYQFTDATATDTVGVRDYSLYKGLFLVTFMICTNFIMIRVLAGVVIYNYNIVRRQADNSFLMTRPQRDWCNAQRILLSFKPLRPHFPLRNFISRRIFSIVESLSFRVFILTIIFANAVFISLEHFDMSHTYAEVTRISNYAFVGIYWVIMLAQLLASGPVFYTLSTKWNIFDAVLNVLVLIDIIVKETAEDEVNGGRGLYINFNIFRLLQFVQIVDLIRIYGWQSATYHFADDEISKSEEAESQGAKRGRRNHQQKRRRGFWMRQLNGLRIAMFTLWFSLPGLLSLAFILLFFFVSFSIIGVHAFAMVRSGLIVNDSWYPNFNNFFNSLILMFRMVGLEDWDRVMRDTMHITAAYHSSASSSSSSSMLLFSSCREEHGHNCGSYVAPLFFVPMMFLFGFVFVYLTVAIILENFEAVSFIEGNAREYSALASVHEFSYLWQRYDPQGTSFIPTHQLPFLLEELRPHRGVIRASDRDAVVRKLAEYQIPDHDGHVYFSDVMLPIVRAGTGIYFTPNQLRLQHETWRQYKMSKVFGVGRVGSNGVFGGFFSKLKGADEVDERSAPLPTSSNSFLFLFTTKNLKGSTCTADQYLLTSYARSVFSRRMGRLYVQKLLRDRHVDGRRECLQRGLNPHAFGYNGKRFGPSEDELATLNANAERLGAVIQQENEGEENSTSARRVVPVTVAENAPYAVPDPVPSMSSFTHRALEIYRARIEERGPNLKEFPVDYTEGLLTDSAAVFTTTTTNNNTNTAAHQARKQAEVEELLRLGRRPSHQLLIEAGLKHEKSRTRWRDTNGSEAGDVNDDNIVVEDEDMREIPLALELRLRQKALRRENPRRASQYVLAARKRKALMDVLGDEEEELERIGQTHHSREENGVADEHHRVVIRSFKAFEQRTELSPEDAVSPSTASQARRKNKAIRYPPPSPQIGPLATTTTTSAEEDGKDSVFANAANNYTCDEEGETRGAPSRRLFAVTSSQQAGVGGYAVDENESEEESSEDSEGFASGGENGGDVDRIERLTSIEDQYHRQMAVALALSVATSSSPARRESSADPNTIEGEQEKSAPSTTKTVARERSSSTSALMLFPSKYAPAVSSDVLVHDENENGKPESGAPIPATTLVVDALGSRKRRFGPEMPHAIRRNMRQGEKLHRDQTLLAIKKEKKKATAKVTNPTGGGGGTDGDNVVLNQSPSVGVGVVSSHGAAGSRFLPLGSNIVADLGGVDKDVIQKNDNRAARKTDVTREAKSRSPSKPDKPEKKSVAAAANTPRRSASVADGSNRHASAADTREVAH